MSQSPNSSWISAIENKTDQRPRGHGLSLASLPVDGKPGLGTLKAYKELLSNKEVTQTLMKQLAEERCAFRKGSANAADERRKLRPSSFGEAARADHFRIER